VVNNLSQQQLFGNTDTQFDIQNDISTMKYGGKYKRKLALTN
jgi:hypothetical protein